MGKDIRQSVSVVVLRESVPLHLESENDDFQQITGLGLAAVSAILGDPRNSLRFEKRQQAPATKHIRGPPRTISLVMSWSARPQSWHKLTRWRGVKDLVGRVEKNDYHLETSWNFVYSLFKMLSMILSLLKDRCCDRCRQIIATSPKCSWGREIPWVQGKLGWWNIVIWTDRCLSLSTFVLNPQNPQNPRNPTGFPTEACFGCSWPWSLRVPLVFFFARSTWFNT